MVAQAVSALERRYGKTHRKDRWWVEPLLSGSGLGLFVIYSTVSVLIGPNWAYETDPAVYLSPFFEPLFTPEWLPRWFSPGILILWGPIGFRTTCYYYRRTYYRSYLLSPPACAVAEPAASYSGEAKFPFILQNVHRYTMYVALVFAGLLWVGAAKSFWLPGEGLGVGLGSLILTANAFFISMYTIGCHSLRHWVAGGLNSFSRTPIRRLRRKAWEIFTIANEKHRLWAWVSMIFVGVTDLYIRLVATGVIPDLNTWKSF